jgi:Histidine kinase-, DNA gyrase B-, and HSP90-like ATPase
MQNTGIGIAAEQLPRIFAMFTQVDTSFERSGDGLGVGLTLVKNVVEMHDGTAGARSAGVGQGSELVVRLPVNSAPLPAVTFNDPAIAPGGALLVDGLYTLTLVASKIQRARGALDGDGTGAMTRRC